MKNEPAIAIKFNYECECHLRQLMLDAIDMLTSDFDELNQKLAQQQRDIDFNYYLRHGRFPNE